MDGNRESVCSILNKEAKRRRPAAADWQLLDCSICSQPVPTAVGCVWCDMSAPGLDVKGMLDLQSRCISDSVDQTDCAGYTYA